MNCTHCNAPVVVAADGIWSCGDDACGASGSVPAKLEPHRIDPTEHVQTLGRSASAPRAPMASSGSNRPSSQSGGVEPSLEQGSDPGRKASSAADSDRERNSLAIVTYALDVGQPCIWMFGDAETGKTTYLAALLHRLQHKDSPLKVIVPDRNPNYDILKDAMGRMYRREDPVFPVKTTEAKILAYKLMVESRFGRLRPLVIVDTMGDTSEGTNAGARGEKNTFLGQFEHAPRARGILYLVRAKSETLGQQLTFLKNALHRIASTRKTRRVEIPLFVGITQADELDPQAEASSADELRTRLGCPYDWLHEKRRQDFATIRDYARHFKVGWVSVGRAGKRSMDTRALAPFTPPLGILSGFEFVTYAPSFLALGGYELPWARPPGRNP